jgi:hypothetical protein
MGEGLDDIGAQPRAAHKAEVAKLKEEVKK